MVTPKQCIIGVLIFIGAAVSYEKYGNDIPDVLLELPDNQIEKLKELQTVSLVQNRIVTTDECPVYSSKSNAYYLVSGYDSMNADYAKWHCAKEMAELNCPQMQITFNNAHTPVATRIRGSSSTFALNEVQTCAAEAIKYAATEPRPTMDNVLRRKSWIAPQ